MKDRSLISNLVVDPFIPIDMEEVLLTIVSKRAKVKILVFDIFWIQENKL